MRCKRNRARRLHPVSPGITPEHLRKPLVAYRIALRTLAGIVSLTFGRATNRAAAES